MLGTSSGMDSKIFYRDKMETGSLESEIALTYTHTQKKWKIVLNSFVLLYVPFECECKKTTKFDGWLNTNKNWKG